MIPSCTIFFNINLVHELLELYFIGGNEDNGKKN